MRIECYDPTASIVSTTASYESSEDLPTRVLYAPLHSGTRSLSIDDRLARLARARRRAAQVLILRAHGRDAQELARDEVAIENISLVTERRPVWLLTLDGGRLELSLLSGEYAPPTSGAARTQLIDGLRQADFQRLVEIPGALLPAAPEFHYEGPNGSHYAQFLRVGIALHASEALETVCFWLTPHMHGADLLLVDSPTVFSAALAARHYYEEEVATAESRMQVDCVRGYIEPPEALRVRAARLLDSRHDGRVLFVNSVCSSGRMIESVMHAMDGYSVTGVSMFGSGSTRAELAGTVFCQLDENFERRDAGDCDLCAKRTPTVRINRTTYLLELGAASKEARLKAVDALEAKTFLDRYGGRSAIRVHRQRHDGARHHAIDIDVAALIGSAAFDGRLRAALSRLASREIDLILAPEHDAARKLMQIAEPILGAPGLLKDERSLRDIGPAEKESLTQARRILIIDDVSVSGDRLYGYKNQLRELGVVDEGVGIGALVGVARPATLSHLRGIMDYFRGPLGFSSVEQLILPNWDEECPWCEELGLWEQVSHFLDDDDVFGNERYDALRDVGAGLQQSVFLRWGNDERCVLGLGPDSIFGKEDLNEAELFTSVASAMQTLRDQQELQERPMTPLARALDPSCWATGRFYDQIITAAILRAARRHDLFITSTELALRDVVERRLTDDTTVAARAEFLLAIAQGKLPRTPVTATLRDALVKERRGPRGFLGLLLSEGVP